MAIFDASTSLGRHGVGPQMRPISATSTRTIITRRSSRGWSRRAWWADIGCGRDIFPSNLACKGTVGTVRSCSGSTLIEHSAEQLHQRRLRRMVEDCSTDYRFDLITLNGRGTLSSDRSVAKLA
jgi:hypothetical protein